MMMKAIQAIYDTKLTHRPWDIPGLPWVKIGSIIGGRGESQSNAAEGVLGHRQVFRRITVPGTPENTPLSVVRAALLRDPISIAYQHGGVLLDHTVLVG